MISVSGFQITCRLSLFQSFMENSMYFRARKYFRVPCRWPENDTVAEYCLYFRQAGLQISSSDTCSFQGFGDNRTNEGFVR